MEHFSCQKPTNEVMTLMGDGERKSVLKNVRGFSVEERTDTANGDVEKWLINIYYPEVLFLRIKSKIWELLLKGELLNPKTLESAEIISNSLTSAETVEVFRRTTHIEKLQNLRKALDASDRERGKPLSDKIRNMRFT